MAHLGGHEVDRYRVGIRVLVVVGITTVGHCGTYLQEDARRVIGDKIVAAPIDVLR